MTKTEFKEQYNAFLKKVLPLAEMARRDNATVSGTETMSNEQSAKFLLLK